MREAIEAACDAAYDYEPRNAGEEGHVLLIRGMLDDARLRMSMLDDYANEHARSEAVNAANEASAKAASDLAAAQQVTVSSSPAAQPAAPSTGPDPGLEANETA